MNVKVEKIEKNKIKMEIEVPSSKFDEAVEKSFKKNAGKFNIPGFRKGKAPKHIIEQYYGKGVFYEDAVDFIVNETYKDAIEQEDIYPVDYPKVDIVSMNEGENFVYSAEVVVKPEVKLGKYKGVEVKKFEYPVTDEDIEKQLQDMKEKNARIEDKESGIIENGDVAVIDFEGSIDGVPFEGGKGENYELTVGSNTLIPGFEEQLIGAKLNDEVNVNVTFPEDYSEESLKGKAASFKVKINAVKYKEFPELDDDFAKDVSEFDTLDELKKDIRNKQEETNKEREKRDFEEEIIKKVVEAADVEVPEVMISGEVDYMLKEYDMRLKYQGFSLDKYLNIMNKTVDQLREEFKGTAEERVKTDLVFEAIAKAEAFEATEEEMDKKAEEMASKYGTNDPEKLKENILKAQKNIIKNEIVNNKVIDLLVKESKTIK
ncbi:MAG TPA: trigger factor [Clostridiaceae bacterium]|jgi:trigger factor|nr:trigger factor [Clostridiaceae bacterium]HBF77032.1 trigger factor [Clostridiaceae bacterium]HBG38761.1 trigger factor [Clostridiaceae bacterium]HBN28693.1 trigger factor [Clostridiaceae bacterium]HBX47476.1 trigger factor [Clostridiaceae bacterium]